MTIRSTTTLLVIACISMVAGFWLSMQYGKGLEDDSRGNIHGHAGTASSLIQGAVLDPPRRISMPELQRDDGKPFTNDDIRGKWTLWFFGYTHCPDICPATLAMTANAKRKAEARGIEFPQVTFVSVDPERDNMKQIAEYVRYFDEDFVGITGEEEMLKALTLQMSILFMKIDAEAGSDAGYLVDHSASLLLTNPDGNLVAFLNPPHDPETVLKDLATVTAGH